MNPSRGIGERTVSTSPLPKGKKHQPQAPFVNCAALLCLFLATLAIPDSSLAQAPAFESIKTFGGPAEDQFVRCAVDSFGNVYAAGSFAQTVSFEGTNVTSRGGFDAVVTKFSATGTLLWVRSLGGPGDDSALGLGVDGLGNVYFTGYFSGSAQFGDTNITAIGQSIYVAKIGTNGVPQWVRTAGSGVTSRGLSVGVFNRTNVYLTGFYAGEYQPGLASANLVDYFLAKYDSDGRLQWVQHTGGVDFAGGTGATADRVGNIYTTGRFKGDATFGSYQFSHGATGGRSDIFLVKYDPLGNVVWARWDGRYQDSQTTGIITDSLGNCYIAGQCSGGMIFGGSFFPASDSAGFLAKYSSSGTFLWVQFVDGDGQNVCNAVGMDAGGNVYASGSFSGTSAFGSTNMTSSGFNDAFVAKFNSSGGLQWAQKGGGSQNDLGNGVAIDRFGSVYMAGAIYGNATFEPIAVGLTNNPPDMFLAKRSLRPPVIVQGPQPQDVVAGSMISLFATVISPAPPIYRWLRNGIEIGTASDSTLSILAKRSDAGSYQLVATSSDGSVTSAPVTVRIFFSVTTSFTGIGTVTTAPDEPSFLPDAVVTLRATPADGYLFESWSGNASGTNDSIQVIVTNNLHVVANFVPVLVTTAAEGDGYVERIPDKASYNLGEELTLFPRPGRWYEFTCWRDGATDNPRHVQITFRNDYSAVFSPTTVLETVTFDEISRTAPAGMPVVLVDEMFVPSGNARRTNSATVALSTSFEHGSIFFTLDGSAPSFESRLYDKPLLLRGSATFRAIAYNASFSKAWECDPIEIAIEQSCSVEITLAGGGSVAVSPAKPFYAKNESVGISALAEPGWQFLYWLGDLDGTNDSASLQVTKNCCIRPIFGTTFSSTVSGPGSLVIDPVLPAYPYGTAVRLSGLPDPGAFFGAWGTDLHSTNNPVLLIITTPNPAVSSVFGALASGQNSLTLQIVGAGRVSQTPRGNHFASGQRVLLSALPDAGQEFLGWDGDVVGTATNTSILIDGSKVARANFTSRPILATEPCGGLGIQSFRVLLTGQARAQYEVQHSTNLLDWQPIASVSNRFGLEQFTNPRLPSTGPQFYRLRAVP